ncbi:MAG: hypothetical protein Q8M76_18160, partial [Spirochaetaceae bacterium]|nr:hypothetical protein [Spirochaetaceae bacterium]
MNTAESAPKGKFEFVNKDEAIRDAKFETRPIGYFQDAMIRLGRSKASVASFYVICLIAFFSVFGPAMTPYGFNDQDVAMANMPPRIPVLETIGIADGTRVLANKRA